jgi:hypothetical protein
MATKTLTPQALSIIDSYLHFKIDPRINSAECSIPYFNNKTIKARAALRSVSGKGSPQEIREEVQALLIKDHVDPTTVTGEDLKRVLTDNNIGIDCSAFAYYILNAESLDLGRGSIKKRIRFSGATGLIGKIRCALRPIENFDVMTFADGRNSLAVSLKDVRPGDIVTMIDGPEGGERNHILVVHRVDYADSDAEKNAPTKIHYSHAVAYPEDGVYGTGIKQGIIEIARPEGPLAEQTWTERALFARAQKSKTELRCLKILSHLK